MHAVLLINWSSACSWNNYWPLLFHFSPLIKRTILFKYVDLSEGNRLFVPRRGEVRGRPRPCCGHVEQDGTLTLRCGGCGQKWLLEPRSRGLMMVTRKRGWRALIRTPLMQWRSQQASFRVTAHLKKWRLALPPSPSFFFILSFAPSVANLSQPHPLIRAHLRIGHCASGWLAWLDGWWRPGRRLTVQAHSWQQRWVGTLRFVESGISTYPSFWFCTTITKSHRSVVVPCYLTATSSNT